MKWRSSMLKLYWTLHNLLLTKDWQPHLIWKHIPKTVPFGENKKRIVLILTNYYEFVQYVIGNDYSSLIKVTLAGIPVSATTVIHFFSNNTIKNMNSMILFRCRCWIGSSEAVSLLVVNKRFWIVQYGFSMMERHLILLHRFGNF